MKETKKFCGDCGQELNGKENSCPKCGNPDIEESLNRKGVEKLNNEADKKVHDSLEMSSMIITIAGTIAGFIIFFSGLTADGIIFSNVASGITLLLTSYISGLSFRWMASVLRILTEIKTKRSK